MINTRVKELVKCQLCGRSFFKTESQVEYVIAKDGRSRYYCHDCLRREGMQDRSFGRKEVSAWKMATS